MKPLFQKDSLAVNAERIPGDAILPATDGRGVVEGLVAVGVPLGEALRPYTANMSAPEAIRLSGEYAKSGVERMRALFEVQKDFEDKKAFGRACVEAGFSPVGVALAAEEGHVVKDLIAAFGVDDWLAGGFVRNLVGTGYLLSLNELTVRKLSPLPLFVPGDLNVRWNVQGTRTVPLDCFVEIGGSLCANRCTRVSFSKLRAVGGDILVANSESVFFLALKSIPLELSAEHAKDLWLPVLESVGGDLNGNFSSGLSCPNLKSIIGQLALSHSEGASLPVVESVGSWSMAGASQVKMPKFP